MTRRISSIRAGLDRFRLGLPGSRVFPPGAQWWANGPNDIPIGMVWVFPGFGQYSSGGAYVPYYGCDCCEGGGYDNPSVAESLDPAGEFGPLGPGYPSGYEFGGGGIGGGDSGTAGMVSPIEIVDSSHENRSFIGASGQTAWGLPPPPPPPPVLSDNEATVLNMALAAGSSASQNSSTRQRGLLTKSTVVIRTTPCG